MMDPGSDLIKYCYFKKWTITDLFYFIFVFSTNS